MALLGSRSRWCSGRGGSFGVDLPKRRPSLSLSEGHLRVSGKHRKRNVCPKRLTGALTRCAPVFALDFHGVSLVDPRPLRLVAVSLLGLNVIRGFFVRFRIGCCVLEGSGATRLWAHPALYLTDGRSVGVLIVIVLWLFSHSVRQKGYFDIHPNQCCKDRRTHKDCQDQHRRRSRLPVCSGSGAGGGARVYPVSPALCHMIGIMNFNDLFNH